MARWMAPIIATMETMPPDDAPVQAMAPMNATMESMPPVMALGGRLRQRQLLHASPTLRWTARHSTSQSGAALAVPVKAALGQLRRCTRRGAVLDIPAGAALAM